MRYQNIKGLQTEVSRLVMGTMILDDQRQDESDRLLDGVYDVGVNTFDTGLVYLNGSEVALGRWINGRGLRDKVNVITKGGHHSAFRRRVTPFDILSDCHESLARLDIGRIDIYLLHRDDPGVPVAAIIDVLNRLHDEGKIGVFGGSNWTHERLAEANDYAERFGLMGFSASSPNYALAEQVEDPWGGGCVTISGPQNHEAREFYRRTQMPVFAYSSLCRGFLSGLVRSSDPSGAERELDEFARKGFVHPRNFERLRRCEILADELGIPVPTVAMAWLFRQPENVFAIVGAASGEQMAQNAVALDIELTDRQLRWLNLEDEDAAGL